ncbi:MAG TPA: Crp/Fnr family transcriptional regulator [Puia sp.]|nr:Crp/Fnr family transcriptional regulator [Puia sp.]
MSQEIKFVYLKNHPLFANVCDQKIRDACSLAKIRTVYRGETLDYGSGDYTKLYLLVKGKIKITDMDEMDNELIKDILTAPDIFGDLGLEGKPSGDEYAEALTANTITCIFNVPDFRKLMQDSPMMALNYANTVNDKLKKLQTRHSDLVFRDAKSRLIRFIKNWARTDGSRIGDKIILNNYLTHSDIAGVIATSRQSVNMLLNELRDSGLLLYNRKHIELNDARSWN